MAPTNILFDGQCYRARGEIRPDDSVIVVTFDHWSPSPTVHGAGYAEEFLKKRGYNWICIKTNINDWWQSDEFDDLAAVVRRATLGRRLVGYGGSMGGFGAINHAELLGLSSVVCVAPQYAIGDAVPWEHRWRDDAEKIAFKRYYMNRERRLRSGYIICDPWSMDGRHAALIQQRHDVTVIPVYGSDHYPGIVLQECRLFDELVQGLFVGRLDLPSVLANLRRKRRGSQTYLLSVGHRLVARKRLKLGLEFANAARALPDEMDFSRTVQYSSILAASGRGGEAVAALAPFAFLPGSADYARSLIRNWLA